MTLIFDVDYNTFRAFKKTDAVFFWSEEAERFVLLKVMNGINIRCTVAKDTNEANDMFKLRELFNYSGIFCKRISVGPDVEKVPAPQSVYDVNDVKIGGTKMELKSRRVRK